MSESDHIESVEEPVEETDTSGLLDAPNQQVVRPDESGPSDEGEGGTVHEEEGPAGLDAMTKAELIEEASKRGVDVHESATKAEIKEALEG
jgi:hypothetical protein